jgi:hypothetical protein
VSIYSMSSPTYTGMSRQALFDSAMSQPLSLTSTLVDQGKGGALESFGLGTVLRESQVPMPAPSDEAPYGFDPSGLDVPAGISPQDYLQGNWVTPDMIAKKRAEMGALSEDQYKASPFYRKDIPYDPGMTSAGRISCVDERCAEGAGVLCAKAPIRSLSWQHGGPSARSDQLCSGGG